MAAKKKGGAPRGRKPRRPWRQIIDECVGKALSNSFRQQILWIINERVSSPTEIATELGESLSKVCHHIKVLKEAKCIELAHTRIVGNRVQSFYKANARAFLDDVEWPKVPDSLKRGLRATLLQNILDDSIEAVVEGTYDTMEPSGHMSWTPMILDVQGCGELRQILDRALFEAIDLQENTKERLTVSGEAGISCTVSILGYASVGGEKTVLPSSNPEDLAAAAGVKGAQKAKRRRGSSKSRKSKAPSKQRTAKAAKNKRRGK